MTTPTPTQPDSIPPLAAAIARMEGYLASPFSRAARNNNPGDIEWGFFARTHGADRIEVLSPGRTPRFAHFPTPEAGFAALAALITEHYAGSTIAAMMAHYAPPSENNTQHYIDFICAATGLPADHIITAADLQPPPSAPEVSVA